MAKDLIVNYNEQPCYSICIRDNFEDLIFLIKDKINKEYDGVCIVSDSNVAGLYLKEVLDAFKQEYDKVSSFSFEAGEQSKKLATVELLYEHLILKKLLEHFLLQLN